MLSNQGTKIKTLTVNHQDQFSFPSIEDTNTSVFIGWATRPNGTLSNVKYYPGDAITVSSDKKVYAVYFEKSRLTRPGSLPRLSSKYGQVIIVGDSRANRTYLRLKALNYFDKNTNVKFIFKEGAGLRWFYSEGGITRLRELVSSGKSQKPTAVVMMLGVNQLNENQNYYSVYTSLANELSAKNCKLFLTTINPISSYQIQKVRGNTVEDRDLLKRNENLKRIPGYTVIDTRKYLLQNGYIFDRGIPSDTGVDDGLHYDTTTYLRIFTYVMNAVNRS